MTLRLCRNHEAIGEGGMPQGIGGNGDGASVGHLRTLGDSRTVEPVEPVELLELLELLEPVEPLEPLATL
jgi:hypothetical protein